MREAATARAGLCLLPGGADDLLERTGWDAPPPRARPSDRCEPWPLDRTRAMPLVLAARETPIAFELAAVATVERCLLENDLLLLARAGAGAALDAVAARAAVSRELSEASSAYLAALDGAAGGGGQAPAMLALPMRLGDRLGARNVVALLDPQLLHSAISWERAAVLSGRTMSEWALMALVANDG